MDNDIKCSLCVGQILNVHLGESAEKVTRDLIEILCQPIGPIDFKNLFLAHPGGLYKILKQALVRIHPHYCVCQGHPSEAGFTALAGEALLVIDVLRFGG